MWVPSLSSSSSLGPGQLLWVRRHKLCGFPSSWQGSTHTSEEEQSHLHIWMWERTSGHSWDQPNPPHCTSSVLKAWIKTVPFPV